MSGSGAGFEWGAGADYLLACSLDCWWAARSRETRQKRAVFFSEVDFCAGGSLLPAAVLLFENYS